METKIQTAASRFAEKTPAQIINDSDVKNKFVQLYKMIHGKKNGELFYQTESFHFLKLLNERPDLQACDRLSIYGCFLDAAVNDISLDPGMKQAYLVPFGNKCTLVISPYGELHMRIRSGQIKHADNPVLVFEGDRFSFGTRAGKGFVEHEAIFPRKSDKIMACYIRLERPDGSEDYKVLSREEFEKIKLFSKQPGGTAYTKGEHGMFMAKTLKHAFKSYNRIRLRGTYSAVETALEENGTEEVSFDYEIEETKKISPNTNANGNGKPSQAAQVAAESMKMSDADTHQVEDETF